MCNKHVPGKRIVIVGTTASGKTTLAKQLAACLNYPRIELDALNWDPNWTESADFLERVEAATQPETWVLDGNYSRARHIIWERADTAIWLDYPMWLNYWRLTKRTLRRVTTREELWNGNRESWRNHFSKDSLFLFLKRSHGSRRQKYGAIIAENQWPTLNWIHLQSPRATNRWLNNVCPDR